MNTHTTRIERCGFFMRGWQLFGGTGFQPVSWKHLGGREDGLEARPTGKPGS